LQVTIVRRCRLCRHRPHTLRIETQNRSKSSCSAKRSGLRSVSGASRTRTGDLLGAITPQGQARPSRAEGRFVWPPLRQSGLAGCRGPDVGVAERSGSRRAATAPAGRASPLRAMPPDSSVPVRIRLRSARRAALKAKRSLLVSARTSYGDGTPAGRSHEAHAHTAAALAALAVAAAAAAGKPRSSPRHKRSARSRTR